MIFGTPPITFVYHLGAHATDEDLLVRSLLRDGVALQDEQVIIPRPRKYRQRVRDVMHEYRGEPPPEEVQEDFFEELLQGYDARRVFLSDPDYLTKPQSVLDGGELYAKSGFRSVWLRYLFPENPCEFFLGLRDPATLLPAMLRLRSMPSHDKLLEGVDPRQLSWTGVVERIVENNPGCPVTVWCNEDLPLIWPELLRAAAGVPRNHPMNGDHDVLRTIMTETGLEKLEAFLQAKPPASDAQRRQIVAAFADKFAMEDELEEEIDLPGWTPALVEEMTARYDADVAQIERMEGVRFLAA